MFCEILPSLGALNGDSFQRALRRLKRLRLQSKVKGHKRPRPCWVQSEYKIWSKGRLGVMQEDQTVTCFRVCLCVHVRVSTFRCDNAAELNCYCSQGSRVVIQYSPASALQGFSRGLLCFTECVSNMEQVVHHRVCWFYTRAHTHRARELWAANFEVWK